nr:B3 domain-containing protein Os02g0598200-like [Solanum lycopersicum]
MEACFDESEKGCLLNNGKSPFFTVMIEEGFLEVLLFPPKFAKSVSHMIDREINLEDSCGLLWRVTVCKHNGSLAIKQGWPEFSSGHDVKVGEFIVFQYVPSDEHFIVQIFGTSGCERRTLPKPISLVGYLHQVKYNLTEDNHVVRSELADSRDTPSVNTINYCCLVDVNGQNFLKLSESWRKYLPDGQKFGRCIVFLRSPDKRIWPTYYHSRSKFDVLTSGWDKVTAAYDMNAGDKCLFQLVDQQGRLFNVRKVFGVDSLKQL